MKSLVVGLVFLIGTEACAEQVIVFNATRMSYRSGTTAESCELACKVLSRPNVKQEMEKGWRIVASSPAEMIGREYWDIEGCDTCQPHGCTCIGTEYVLEKIEEPAPVKTKKKPSK